MFRHDLWMIYDCFHMGHGKKSWLQILEVLRVIGARPQLQAAAQLEPSTPGAASFKGIQRRVIGRKYIRYFKGIARRFQGDSVTFLGFRMI